MTDHQRGCEGRTYTCTCGYDDQLVWIGPDAVERVARAIDHQLVWEIEADVLASSLTREEQIKVARAAIAALKGEE
jgi:hypothetical protein